MSGYWFANVFWLYTDPVYIDEDSLSCNLVFVTEINRLKSTAEYSVRGKMKRHCDLMWQKQASDAYNDHLPQGVIFKKDIQIFRFEYFISMR